MTETTDAALREETPEVTELTREAKLPDSRLRPIQCGWSRRQMLLFNRFDLPFYSVLQRLRERDSYVVGDERVLLSVSVVDYAFCGAVCVTVIDLSGAKERSMTKLIPFSNGHLELPVSAATGDVMYRSEDTSLDFLRAPGKRYIRLRVNHFDDVRSLYVNLILEDGGEDSAFSMVPLGKRSQHFLLRHGIYAMPASGQIVLGADVYELTNDAATGWLERERSDGSRVPEHARLSVTGRCGGEPFGLCVSDGGRFAAENTIIFAGTAYRLENAALEREDGVWHAFTPDERISLYLTATAARTERLSLFGLSAERRREFGLALGEMTVCGERHVVDSAIGCGEQVASKC